MTPEEKLASLGYELPDPPQPGGSYVPWRRVGNLVYLSGVVCVRNGEFTHTGKVGEAHDLESAQEAARVCALNVLASTKAAAGSFDNVKQVVFIGGYVNGVTGYPDSPLVINGASDLLAEVLGEKGKHARAAVTVAGLPKDSTVELQAVVELVD